MKITKLILLVALICTTSLKVRATDASTPTTVSSKNTELAIQKYQEAVIQLLATQPTSLLGDMTRLTITVPSSIVLSLIPTCFTIFIENKTGDAIYMSATLVMWVALIYPLLRVFFDKTMRNTGELDKYLNILTSEENLNGEALAAADIDTKDIEAKILVHGDKFEFLRWFWRSGEIGIILAAAFGAQVLRTSKIKTSGVSVPVAGTALVATILACWDAFITHSATFKTSSRIEKLKKLRLLLAQAKREAERKI